MLTLPKYRHIQDYQKHLTLREGIEDLLPYEVTLPDPPPMEEFINFGRPVDQQIFERDHVPKWLSELNMLAKRRNKKGEDRDYREEARIAVLKDPEKIAYVEDKWRKREEGVFILINGRPTYIPGNMWFYLNYYHIFQYGLPDFRMPDVEWWYHWNYCVVEDPTVYGSIEMAMRRDGKTSRHAANNIELITRETEKFSGFIGRANKDAKKAFLRAYIMPIRKLPFFFTPKIDSPREYPSEEMYFRDPKSVVGGLNNRLDLRATVATAYDGDPLHRFHGNEFGKIADMLVTECWDITKECLQERGHIMGKAAIESTCEEMNVGGVKEFRTLIKNSSRSSLNEFGQTESGLVVYYRPAWELYVIDKYGFPIIDDPTPEQAEWRKQQLLKRKGGDKLVRLGYHEKGGKELVDILINSQKDPVKRQGTIRRYSRNMREALRTDAKDCHFDIDIIENRLDDFKYGNTEVIGLKMSWRSNVQDTHVDYRIVKPRNPEIGFSYEECEGLLLIKKSLWDYIEPKLNNVVIRDGWRMPGNSKLGVIACDPYKYDADATESERKSLGTAHAYISRDKEIDPNEDHYHWKTDDLLAEFTFRGSVDAFDEKMMMMCSLLGMKFSPETNSGDVLPQFSRRRYDRFLYFEKKVKVERNHVKFDDPKRAGFVTLGEITRQPLYNSVEKYIDLRGHQCVFPRFLENCRDVEHKKETKYDHFISGGNAIRICEKMNYKRGDKAKLYTCPDHPDVAEQFQGECPICENYLILKTEKGFTGLWEPTAVQS